MCGLEWIYLILDRFSLPTFDSNLKKYLSWNILNRNDSNWHGSRCLVSIVGIKNEILNMRKSLEFLICGVDFHMTHAQILSNMERLQFWKTSMIIQCYLIDFIKKLICKPLFNSCHCIGSCFQVKELKQIFAYRW